MSVTHSRVLFATPHYFLPHTRAPPHPHHPHLHHRIRTTHILTHPEAAVGRGVQHPRLHKSQRAFRLSARIEAYADRRFNIR